MNLKILRTNDSDSSVARTVSNMLLNNYKKGLAISNNEVAEESGVSNAIGVDPTTTVRVGKQKSTSLAGPAFGPGYKVKAVNATDVPKTITSTGSVQAKEFILQSNALDNELDHAVALMKLDNKNQFYEDGLTGDVESNLYKKIVNGHLDETQELKELQEEMQQHMVAYAKLKARHKQMEDADLDIEYPDDFLDLEAEIKDMEARYDELSTSRKEMLEEQKQNVPNRREIIPKLKEDGNIIDRRRSGTSGQSKDFKNMEEAEYDSTLSGKNSHLKSKRGVRVVSKLDVATFSSDLLLAIKKISNHINVVLMPLAQKMYEKRFQGISLQDKNETIPEMYQDMDEKMYILTSLNNQDNTQLKKLDKEFDKLYSMVKNGLDMYVMPTGGSMVGGHVRTSTNYMYEL